MARRPSGHSNSSAPLDLANQGVRDTFARWERENSSVRETSFSGTSLHVGFVISGHEDVIEAENIQTISYSTLRSTSAVRSLGEVAPKGFTRGSRTVAGTIITTMFQFDPLYDYWVNYLGTGEESEKEYSSPFYDDLMPPFTIVIDGMTELGQHSNMAIRGVRIANTGVTLSVDDMMVEKQYTYVAEWVEPFVGRNEWVDQLRHELSTYPTPASLSRVLDYNSAKALADIDPLRATDPNTREFFGAVGLNPGSI